MRTLAVVVALLGLATPGWALEEGATFSRTEGNHTVFEHAVYEYFFNNSGAALVSGQVVVYDRSGTGVNTGISGSLTTVPTSAGRNSVDVDGSNGDVTNVGTYITTSTTADDPLVAGVVDDDSCAASTYCRVQVFGPRLVTCAGSTDAVTAATAVGTSTVAGQCGSAAAAANGILGTALTATATTPSRDNSIIWVFIRTSSSDG